LTKKLILGEALTQFIESLEYSNDDESSQSANEARYQEIIKSYQDEKVLESATSKQVVSAFYTLAEFLKGDLPGKYEDLMPEGMDSFFYEDIDSGIYEAFEIVGHDKFPASEIDNLIVRQKSDGILEVGTVGPMWLTTKVLKRQQYLDLWEMSSTMVSEFDDGYKEGLVQNPMTPKKLLLEAAENGWFEIRKKIAANPKVDDEILEILKRKG
jgi:hypothetical protein